MYYVHRVDHEVTQKADSNVSNIIIGHRFQRVPLPRPFLIYLKVPLLPTGIYAYSSSSSTMLWTKAQWVGCTVTSWRD